MLRGATKSQPQSNPQPQSKPQPQSPIPAMSPAPIPGIGTCGDTQPDMPGNQPFNCKALGDFVPNENVTNVGPPNSSECCRPLFSCIDVNPSEPGCQPFYCDTANGWYPNQEAYYRPNPSSEVCCLIRKGMGTQATPDGYLQAIACPAGFYGISDKRYGTNQHICRPCLLVQTTSCQGVPESLITNCSSNLRQFHVAYDGGATLAAFDKRACVHMPGHAWVTGVWITRLGRGSGTRSSITSSPCSDGWYSPGGHNDSCTACLYNLMTGMEGATSEAACVAQPGYRFVLSSRPGIECTDSTYREGYSNAPGSLCTACGSGTWHSASSVPLLKPNPVTGVTGTMLVRGNSSSCYVLPGMGTTFSAGEMTAEACNSGSSYSSNTPTYGNAIPHPCSSCPSFTATSCSSVNDTSAASACQADLATHIDRLSGGFTSVAACRFWPGHGLYPAVGGLASRCPAGTFSPGGGSSTANGACLECVAVTSANFHQSSGAVSYAECKACKYGLLMVDTTCLLPVGYAGQIGSTTWLAAAPVSSMTGITPCPIGWVCAGGDPTAAGAPRPCPQGLTTARVGAISLAECNVVMPGWAPVSQSGAIISEAQSAPAVITSATPCPAGFYCAGGQLPSAGYPVACRYNLSSAAGSQSVDNCNIIAAGQAAVDAAGTIFYAAPVSLSLVKGTAPCPKDFWCGPGGVSVLSAAATPKACTNGLQTEFAGTTTSAACVAPPGHYYSSASAAACPDGTYQAIYNTAASCNTCGSDRRSYLPRTSASNCYALTAIAAQNSYASIHTASGDLAAWSDRGNFGVFSSVAVDQTGHYMAAAHANGDIKYSTDAGSTWRSMPSQVNKYIAVAMDNNGTRIFGVSDNDRTVLFQGTSTDRVTWNWSEISNGFAFAKVVWSAIYVSGDGTKLLCAKAGVGSPLYVGSLSNVTGQWSWTAAAARGDWRSVAVSNTGNTMVAAQFGGHMYISDNSGGSFTQLSGAGYPGHSNYLSVAMNGDGTQLLVSEASAGDKNKQPLGAGTLWLAGVSGSSWTWQTTGFGGPVHGGDYEAVASSRDGQTLLAAIAMVS